MMNSVIKIGTTQGGILSLSLLPAPVAHPTDYLFHEGTKLRGAASGAKLWAGLPWAELGWRIIEQPSRDQLRLFCPGESAEIFTQLPTNDTLSQLVIFSGLMVWAEDEKPAEYYKIPDLKILLINLVPVT